MIHPQRAVDLAADHLRHGVLHDVWPAGTHLPAERELAVELGVSRPTLRAAIARLETEGLLRARQGAGVEVLDWTREGGVELIGPLLAAGRDDLMAPLLQLRRALAAEAVAICCRTASDAELAALDARAAHLGRCSREELVTGNLDFAREVVRLTGNLPLMLLFNTVARLLAERPEAGARLLRDEAAVRASFGAITALIRARDPVWARDLVRRALEAIDGDEEVR